MGCCNSNIRKQNYSEVLVEERVIQTGERQLFFSSRQFSEVLKVIETLPHVNLENFVMLCESFSVQVTSPSGAFLLGLTEKGMISSGMLKNLAVLLCPNDPKGKISQVMSHSKDNLIESIKDLIHISIDVIPNNLENLEKSALLYSNSLKSVSKEYVKELETLTLSQIQELLKDFAISSKDIRIKMYNEMKNSNFNDGLGDKLDRFRAETEEKEEVREREDSLNFKSADLSVRFENIEKNCEGLPEQTKTQDNDLDSLKIEEKIIEPLKNHEKNTETPKNELEINEEIEIPLSRPKFFQESVEDSADPQESIDIKLDLEPSEVQIVPEESISLQILPSSLPEPEKPSEDLIDPSPNSLPSIIPEEIQTIPLEDATFLSPEAKKLEPSSPKVLTPATNLNDDINLNSPQHITEDPHPPKQEPESSPFALSVDCHIKSDTTSDPPSDLSSPRLVPRKSSGLAAKLKATQAFIKSGNINRADTSPELSNVLLGEAQAFVKRRVKQEPFTCDRKSLTSPKSAFEASKTRGFVEEKKE
jgi:hypothetical protein